MGFIKTFALGAAVAYGISYITKKRVTDGKSIVDDITENAPQWAEKAKSYGRQAVDQIKTAKDDLVEPVQTY